MLSRSLRILPPVVSLLSAVAAIPTEAAAQAAEDTARVAPVIVTATRTPLRADQVPASATVITGAALRAQGIAHLADALRAVPGIVVAQSGSFGAPASVFVRGGQSNYTKVLIDGVPANDPGGAFDFGTLTVDDVERIEVVRGPSSVQWGSDAVSAVVHVITRRGTADRAAIAARGGTFGTMDLNGSVERRLLGMRGALSAAHHESDGTFALNSGYRNSVVGASALRVGNASSFRVSGRYASTRAHYPTDFTGAPVDPNSFRIEERATVSAEGMRTVGPATAHLLATHGLVSASSVNPADVQPGTSDSYDTRTRRQGLELRADLPLRTGLALSVGGVVERQRRSSAFNAVTTSDTAPPAQVRTDDRAARTNSGAFAELLASGGPTTVTMGARLDHSETFGEFATYRVGVSHALGSGTRGRASVGTGFREPSFDEALPGPYSAGNPDIRPERSSSWEVGIEQSALGDRLVLGATWFSQRFADMIDYFAATFPGRYENVAAARARGLELEARVRPTPSWLLEASGTQMRTRVETAGFGGTFADGRPLLRRPERTAGAGVSYAARGRSAGLRLAYVGPRQDVRFSFGPPYSAEETLPSYVKLDLSGELPVVARGARSLTLTLRVENVLDGEFQPAAGYDAPGRSVLLGARAAF